jgi:hypothetical protein
MVSSYGCLYSASCGNSSKDWNWCINLGASDYLLVTQDDLLYVFSSLPRDLNFIEHTSDIGWKKHVEKYLGQFYSGFHLFMFKQITRLEIKEQADQDQARDSILASR